MKRLLKDKRGMSLMELLVAFSLLMILIVGTTPVMLSAYNGLYTAGEYTQNTYDAKTEIEDQLATRGSMKIYTNFAVNYQNLGTVAQINAKRAVSSLTGALETLYTGGRAYVTILSGDVVNDDTTTHEIQVKISNYGLKNFNEIYDMSQANSDELPAGKRLGFKVTIPCFSKNGTIYTTENDVYGNGQVVPIYEFEASNLESGLITLTITSENFSFTKSPVQIKIYYYNENEELLEAVDYLHVKTPTIIFAGSTVNNDYYTTSGVVTTKNQTTNETITTFDVAGRKMDISNATGTKDYLGADDEGQTFAYGQAGDADWNPNTGEARIDKISLPEPTVIKSVKWISEYGNNGGNGTSYETNYYVLSGTNGVIYRTYSYTGEDNVMGRVNLSIPEHDGDKKNKERSDYDTNKNGVAQLGKKVVGLTAAPFNINNGEMTIYPAVWGGDFSHIFGWSSSKDGRAYSEGSWYTQQSAGIGQAGYYSNRVNYAYYYNGFATEFDYQTQNSRIMSYVLTEKGLPLRIGGFLEDPDNYFDGMNIIWENPQTYNKVEGTQHDLYKEGFSLFGQVIDPECIAWYRTDSNSLKRCVISTENGSTGLVQGDVNILPVYYANNVVAETSPGKRTENGLAQIRLKGLTTLEPRWLGYRSTGDKSRSDVNFAYNSWVNQSRVNVTDAVYIPGNGVLYLGNVAAYGSIYQNDNISEKDKIVQNVKNNEGDSTGSLTCYYVLSDDKMTQTSIYKYTTKDRNANENNYTLRRPLDNYTQVNETGYPANDSHSKSFFVTRNNKVEDSDAVFTDVLFTMGFSSNREIVYNGISFDVNGTSYNKAKHKSYEEYYFLSEYGSKTHFPQAFLADAVDKDGAKTGDFLNESTNDYYNVWFPEDMYNLTKVATKGDVVVAVGYAVSGSSYQYVNSTSTSNNTSTALGGIFNDGVMSAMVIGQNPSFQNLLYYKDNASMDKTYLTSDSNATQGAYLKHYSEYGTHTRNSVQFTAVGISVENNGYYAYYADNRGRVFKSLVATINSTTNKPQLVSYVASLSNSQWASATAKMEEVKIGVDKKQFSEYFDKITTIKCEDDYIIIAGYTKELTDKCLRVAIGEFDDDGNVVFKIIKIDAPGSYGYYVEDALILGDYIYLTGTSPLYGGGWIYAYNFESLVGTANNGEIDYNEEFFKEVPDEIYAIDGHSS